MLTVIPGSGNSGRDTTIWFKNMLQGTCIWHLMHLHQSLETAIQIYIYSPNLESSKRKETKNLEGRGPSGNQVWGRAGGQGGGGTCTTISKAAWNKSQSSLSPRKTEMQRTTITRCKVLLFCSSRALIQISLLSTGIVLTSTGFGYGALQIKPNPIKRQWQDFSWFQQNQDFT